MLNPTHPADNTDDQTQQPGIDPFRSASVHRHSKTIEPPRQKHAKGSNPAVELIRQKIDALYGDEPNAKEEIREAKQEPTRLSKHQKFMLDLSSSGKSLAEIQTAWHNYYLNLPDNEKHKVWQEFYENNGKQSHFQKHVEHQEKAKAQAAERAKAEQTREECEKPEEEADDFKQHAVNPNDGIVVADHRPPEPAAASHRTVADIKRQIAGRVNAASSTMRPGSKSGQLKAKHHVQSLLFGLGVGSIVIVITLFSFFNEVIITPFIQPSRTASATPLIVGADNVSPTATPEVIIPKINVEIPLSFNVNSTDEDQIENALEDGVVHYPTTVLPGQKGNAAFFGHSSNNIFNPGHYKFAFALLHDLVPGDTFYLTYGGKVYAYQVFQKQVVDPSDVAVLDNVPNYAATATLITCDPPGTSLHRLVVWGEQVSPNPSGNTAGSNTSADISSATQLPSNGPSLWSRLYHDIF